MVPRKVLAWAEVDGKGVAVARKEKELRCGIVYTSTPNPFLWARLSHCWWLNSRPRFHGTGEKKFPLRQTQPFLSFSFKLDQKSWREENSFLLFYSQLWISFPPFCLWLSPENFGTEYSSEGSGENRRRRTEKKGKERMNRGLL